MTSVADVEVWLKLRVGPAVWVHRRSTAVPRPPAGAAASGQVALGKAMCASIEVGVPEGAVREGVRRVMAGTGVAY